jgi:hypothetical protein
MGLFWNLIQQSQIGQHSEQMGGLESRVAFLEDELKRTQQVLRETLKILEEISDKDLDGDGFIGKKE